MLNKLGLQVICITFLLSLFPNLLAQSAADRMMRLTTLITIDYVDGSSSSATGFFFNVYATDDDKHTGPHWETVKETYVVTSRHVIDPIHFDKIKSLTVNFRRADKDKTEWVPVVLAKEELGKRLHLSKRSEIDVAAISINDLLYNKFAPKEGGLIPETTAIPWAAVSKSQFPGPGKMDIASGDDVIVVGYPKLFYDDYNKLPIAKLGMLITPWGEHFRGRDTFLIDYKGFHGASGSIVVSRPSQFFTVGGRLMSSTERDFLFLGVYSGEPFMTGEIKETDDALTQEKIKVDLGEVFYCETVQETIDSPSFH